MPSPVEANGKQENMLAPAEARAYQGEVVRLLGNCESWKPSSYPSRVRQNRPHCVKTQNCRSGMSSPMTFLEHYHTCQNFNFTCERPALGSERCCEISRSASTSWVIAARSLRLLFGCGLRRLDWGAAGKHAGSFRGPTVVSIAIPVVLVVGCVHIGPV